MIHLKPYLIFLFSLISFNNYSQEDSVSTPTKKVRLFPKEYGDKKWKFLFGFDARRSFLKGNKIKINGLKIGAEFRGVHRFGLGFYWLNRNSVFNDIAVYEPNAIQPPEVQIDLNYTSIFYERIFLKTRWWEIAFPIHLGAGSIIGQYRDTLSAMQPLLRAPFSALLLSTQIKFYPLKWLAIRVSGGYRFNYNTSTLVRQSFNRPFYGFGLSVNVVELYKAIFPSKEERLQKREERKKKKESKT